MTASSPSSLSYRVLWVPIGWLLVALVVWGTLTPSPPEALVVEADKLGHVLAYLVLALWFGGLYSGAVRGAYALALAAMGVGLEFLQDAGGVRQFELADMVANGLGVVSGWWMSRFPALNIVGLLDRVLGWARTRPVG